MKFSWICNILYLELNWGVTQVIFMLLLEEGICACLVAQSCPTLCDPMDCTPPGSSIHGDSPGKNTGVDCHALLQGMIPTQGSNPVIKPRSPTLQADSLSSEPPGKPGREPEIKWKLLSCVRLFATPSEFSRQEYWKWVAVSFFRCEPTKVLMRIYSTALILPLHHKLGSVLFLVL